MSDLIARSMSVVSALRSARTCASVITASCTAVVSLCTSRIALPMAVYNFMPRK